MLSLSGLCSYCSQTADVLETVLFQELGQIGLGHVGGEGDVTEDQDTFTSRCLSLMPINAAQG